jgi:hypothetical protein
LADPSVSFKDSTVSMPFLISEEPFVDDGGGNCSTLSIGGGFLGANADDTLDFFLVDAAGGAGKSEELDNDGYADGTVVVVVPLSFRA